MYAEHTQNAAEKIAKNLYRSSCNLYVYTGGLMYTFMLQSMISVIKIRLIISKYHLCGTELQRHITLETILSL